MTEKVQNLGIVVVIISLDIGLVPIFLLWPKERADRAEKWWRETCGDGGTR